MAYVAAATEVGTRKQVNEDSCCVHVAQTPVGEVAMALVCDGVGGLSAGNLASATVVDRFSRWFLQELPALVEGMAASSRGFDFQLVKAVWGALLSSLNELVRTHGAKVGTRMGTTFTGVIACGGRYLVGHVGDCRAFLVGRDRFVQLTEDQTKVARMLAAGEITPEEAARMPKNVILQSVGSGRSLAPAFYEGSCGEDELFVICCDGAYHRTGNDGIRSLFSRVSPTDEKAMQAACEELLRIDLSMGEKDNLTVACLSMAPQTEGERRGAVAVEPAEDDLPTMVEGDEDDMPTQVESEPEADEDDMPTMVEGDSAASDVDEDDLPTMVESEHEVDEDDLPTMVEAGPETEEDDLPTMVEPDAAAEPDVAAVPEADEDDLPTMVEPDAADPDEDDLPTMVEPDAADPDEDDLPTMVEGADA